MTALADSAAPAAMIIPAPADLPAALVGRAAELQALWQKRLSLYAEQRLNSERRRAAEAALPRWAAPGPSEMKHDGSLCGPVLAFPEVENPRPPRDEHSTRLIRVGPNHVREKYELTLMAHPSYARKSEARGRARAQFRRHMRTVIARLRQQREEKRKAGLVFLEAEADRIASEIHDIEQRLDNIAPGTGANGLAALILMEASRSMRFDLETPAGFVAAGLLTLRLIRPHITGAVAQSAAELLDELDAARIATPQLATKTEAWPPSGAFSFSPTYQKAASARPRLD